MNKLLHKLKIHISIYRKERLAIRKAKGIFKDKPIIAVEIGVFKGEHALQMFKHLNIKKLYLIDCYELYKDYEKDTSYKEVIKVEKQAHKLLKKYKKKCVWVKKYSNHAIIDIKDKIDFLYIDGNHYSPYINNDIKLYSQFVKKGGVVSGHDYAFYYNDVVKAVNDYLKNNILYFDDTSDWVIIK